MVFDSDLKRKWTNMPLWYPRDGWNISPPKTMVKSFRIMMETSDGQWSEATVVTENHQRLLRLPLNVETRALRLLIDDTWGDASVNVFSWEVS